jgi:ADP-heptose:LPS heptosyltransferase
MGSCGIFFLRPLATVLGKLLRRDHSLSVKDRIAVVKMLGGGSLVIALPALLGLRRKYPHVRLLLITTYSVKPFADALAVFDEIITVNDSSLITLLRGGFKAYCKIFRIDTILDFEVYSRLTTVLSTISCARNRIGFYLENTFWRERLLTHLVFFNRYAGSYHFYESAIAATGAEPIDMAEAGLHVARSNGIALYESARNGRLTIQDAPYRVCIAPACSELGKERMLNASQWQRILPRLVREAATEVVVLGGPEDNDTANHLTSEGKRLFPHISWINAADGRSLRDSLQLMAGCACVIAIDSSILHFARLFGIPTYSFWGPTDPMTRLKHSPAVSETVWYEKILCSPCIHVAETPPCSGQNVCMEAAVRCCCGEEIDSLTETHHLLPFIGIKRK